jgi:hypothetical protein
MATVTKFAWDVSESDRIASFDSRAHVVQWIGLLQGDEGEPTIMPASVDRSIQFAGTFGGATVVCEGSNDGITYATLNDPLGQPISLTAAGIMQVLELSLYIRPRVVGGDGTTSVSASLLLKRR